MALGLVWLTIGTVLLSGLMTGVNLSQKQLKIGFLADSAALLASDVSRGILPGFPCQEAGQLVSKAGASLTLCRIVGEGVFVKVRSNYLIWSLESWAKAGSP